MARRPIYGRPMTATERWRRHRDKKSKGAVMALRYNEAEVLWAGRSRQMMGGDTNRLGGPDPEMLAEELDELRYLLAAGPVEWALAPLGRLLAAVELARAEVARVQQGGERLRRLGLSQSAVAGVDKDRTGGEFMEAMKAEPPEAMVEVLDARLREEKPAIPEWLGPPSQAPDGRAYLWRPGRRCVGRAGRHGAASAPCRPGGRPGHGASPVRLGEQVRLWRFGHVR